MESTDTIHLLQECDSGAKMAVASFDEVLDKIYDPKLKDLLTESKKHHEKLGNDLHELLLKENCNGKEPNPMAKGMSWLKTNVMINMTQDSDKTVADLITSGCDMGVKSLRKYLNQYQDADSSAKVICNRLITIEETLRDDLRAYL